MRLRYFRNQGRINSRFKISDSVCESGGGGIGGGGRRGTWAIR